MTLERMHPDKNDRSSSLFIDWDFPLHFTADSKKVGNTDAFTLMFRKNQFERWRCFSGPIFEHLHE